MRFAACIVNYNGDIFLEKQIQRIRKYIKLLPEDTLDIIVGDNSDVRGCAECYGKKNNNESICKNNHAIYLPLGFAEGDNSSNHALALNHLYNLYKDNFNALIFFDHDMFVFDHSDILIENRDKIFKGLSQTKQGSTYLHPAILYMNLDKLRGATINFLPSENMDTGGRLYALINHNNTTFLSLNYIAFDEDFYEIIGNKFMHFIKGSNWNGNKNHKKRLEYLFNELEKISK